MIYPIGTRVRVTASYSKTNNAEGVVVGYNHTSNLGEYSDYEVVLPGFISPAGTDTWGADHNDIEPILNDGNQLSTWDEVQKSTGWQPGKVIASVLDNTEESRDE